MRFVLGDVGLEHRSTRQINVSEKVRVLREANAVNGGCDGSLRVHRVQTPEESDDVGTMFDDRVSNVKQPSRPCRTHGTAH
jgi:hypothetical protein